MAKAENLSAERAGDDYRKAQGIVGGEELRSMPVLRRAGRRLSWLSVNILLNVVLPESDTSVSPQAMPASTRGK